MPFIFTMSMLGEEAVRWATKRGSETPRAL